MLGNWLERHRYDKVDPAEIDISDLDPAGQGRWNDDQWARAVPSGLLDRIEAEEEARKRAAPEGDGEAPCISSTSSTQARR